MLILPLDQLVTQSILVVCFFPLQPKCVTSCWTWWSKAITNEGLCKHLSLKYLLTFPANLRNFELALRSHLGSISASKKVLGWKGNSTLRSVHEKPISLLLDRLSISHSKTCWVQGLKSWTHTILLPKCHFLLIFPLTPIVALFTDG